MKPNEPNQGEGNREAAEHYDNDLRKFIAQGKVAPAAKEARDFVDKQPEAAARAERAAVQGPSSTVDELIEKGKTVVERVKTAVVGLKTRIVNKTSK